MRKTKKQSGSLALIVIIIIIVLAILATLGFVFWQKYIGPDTHLTPPVKLEKLNSLTITEWGITGTYQGVNNLYYTIADESILTFHSNDLLDECINASIGLVNRRLLIGTDDPNTMIGDGSAVKILGNYFYKFEPPQVPFSNSCEKKQFEIVDLVRAYFNTLSILGKE